MNWFGWLLTVMAILEIMARVHFVGKPRPVITPGGIIVLIVINSLLIWGYVVYL